MCQVNNTSTTVPDTPITPSSRSSGQCCSEPSSSSLLQADGKGGAGFHSAYLERREMMCLGDMKRRTCLGTVGTWKKQTLNFYLQQNCCPPTASPKCKLCVSCPILPEFFRTTTTDFKQSSPLNVVACSFYLTMEDSLRQCCRLPILQK